RIEGTKYILRPSNSPLTCITNGKKIYACGLTESEQSSLRANNPNSFAFTISKITGGTNHSALHSGDAVYIRAKHDGFFLAHCGESGPCYNYPHSGPIMIDPKDFDQHTDTYKWLIWQFNKTTSLHNEGTPVYQGDLIQFQSMSSSNGWIDTCGGVTLDGYGGHGIRVINDENNDRAESLVRGNNQRLTAEIIDGECSVSVSSRVSCGPVGIEECHRRGCCYDSLNGVVPACYYAPSGPIHRRLPRITLKCSNTVSTLKYHGIELTDGDMQTCFPLEMMTASSVWFDLNGYSSDNFTLESFMPLRSAGLCKHFYPMVGATASQDGDDFKECARLDESFNNGLSKCAYVCACSYGNCNSFTVNFLHIQADNIKVKEHKICEMVIKL
ncbi:unnamed protein product, partial [Owenia fusiformis]